MHVDQFVNSVIQATNEKFENTKAIYFDKLLFVKFCA